jgi:20S proteasome subunit beta 6
MATFQTRTGNVVMGKELLVDAGGVTKHAGFSPYDWNGGTVVAVAGKDFVVIAADKRLTTGYAIKTRNISRIHRLTSKTMIACGGCHADVTDLYKILTYRAVMYKHNHGEEMSTIAAAQLLSNTLYYKRFFPYYALALVAGLDNEGVGYVAGYDAVGSYIRQIDGYSANGSAASLIMPALDNTFGKGFGFSSGVAEKPEYSKNEVIEIVKMCFVSVGERDIQCGDGVDIYCVSNDGTFEEHFFELKKD